MSSNAQSLPTIDAGKRNSASGGLPHYLERLLALAKSDFGSKVTQTYLTQIIKIAIGIATSILLARALGPEGRGVFAVASAMGALGIQFSVLGLQTSNTYFIARDKQLLPYLLGNTLVVSFLYGGAVSGLLWMLFLRFPLVSSVSGWTLVVALLAIPIGLAYLLLQNLLLGLNDVRSFNLIELANRAAPLALLLPFILIHRVSVVSMLAICLAVALLASIWSYMRVAQHLSERLQTSWLLFRSHLLYGIKAYLASFFCFLVLRADLFLVERMLGAEQAGYYSLAATMADMVNILAAAIGAILFPKLSAEKDAKKKLSITLKAVTVTALLMAALLTVAVILARPVISLAFGPAFLPTVPAFLFLAPGIFFLAIHSVSVQYLNSMGYPPLVVLVWAFCAVINIVVNFWAIPHFGITGASFVSSVCYFLATVMIGGVIFRTARQSSCS